MVYRAVYTLKVLHQPDDQSCSFLLLWKDGQRDIYVGDAYPSRLLKDYETWQKHYLRYYRLQARNGIKRSGSLSITPTGDPSQDLRTAEDCFLTTFFRWLGEGAVRKIEQQLQSALIELSQSMTVDQRADAATYPVLAKNAPFLPYQVDLYLACDDVKIQQFPWEQWVVRLVPENIPAGAIRLIRTTKDGVGKQSLNVPRLRLKKARILSILGDDPQLAMHQDWEQLKALRAIATVERVTWNPNASPAEIIQTVFNYIQDDRGWDVLFFTGHSDDVSNRSGTFKLASNVTLAMNDLEEPLEQARKNGLKVAIFNSCSGLRIADSLVRYGIQSVVMREPIRNDAALRFLEYLTQHLLKFNDIHTATLKACGQMRSIDRIGLPSAYLLPSFFSPPNQQPFHIRTVGWKNRLKQWIPTRNEGAALGIILLLSQIVPVKDLLFDLRNLSQAFYRNITHQGVLYNPKPPVHIISINQDSINQAREIKNYSDFQSRPIDRQYLADIITEISNLDAKTVGINYFLNTREENQENFDLSIRKAISKNKIWFILGTDPIARFQANPKTASSDWSLRGSVLFFPWEVALPSDFECGEDCPFAYVSALSYYLNNLAQTNSSPKELPEPDLSSNSSFQEDINDYINSQKVNDQAFFRRFNKSWNARYLIDFSLPPRQVYQRTSSAILLNEGLSNVDLSDQVIFIGAGGYENSDDKFPLPLATRYWQNSNENNFGSEFPNVITGVEIHAYMAHHFLENHLVILIPTLWMIGIAAILGRMINFYMLEQPSKNQHKKILIMMIFGSGIISLQLYISSSIAIPWLLPSIVFVIYTLPIFRREAHE